MSAGALTTSIFVINVVLHKPIIDALLFSLAIAVGITPQLLPAVVSSSLAAGSRRMSRRKVLVKRLVCIEDLGNVDVLFTDKTGTLTAGRIEFIRAVPADAPIRERVLRWGLLCTEKRRQRGAAVGGNPLDQALWDSPRRRPHSARPWPVTPGSACCRSTTNAAWSPSWSATRRHQVSLITKGAPETVLARCIDVPRAARRGVGRGVRCR